MIDESNKPSPDPSTWVDEHGDVLYRFALLRVKDPHVAEDLVQEALVAALQALDSYKGGSSMRTWLVGILKHKIFDHFRKSGREIVTTDLSRLEDESGEQAMDRVAQGRPKLSEWRDDPHNLIENKEFWRVFLACLDGLSPAFRQAFAMREIDDLSTAEICKILDITSTNLWVILHRARAKLRRCLEASWFSEEPAK